MNRFLSLNPITSRIPPFFLGSSLPTVNYPAIVQGISGLLSYWRFGDTSTLLDSVGGRDGTFTSAPALVSTLVPGSLDGSLQFTGQRANIPHDAAFQLAAFTLSFWVRFDTPPSDSTILFPFAKDRSGITAGDFAIGYTSANELWARFQTGAVTAAGVTYELTKESNLYHVVTTADSSGLSLWVDGQFIGTDATYTGAWSVNSTEIRLCNPVFSGVFADITLDEMALYNRVLTTSEIISLSLNSTAPIAPDLGPFEIVGGQDLEINLIASATYTGLDPTVAIVTKSDLTGASHDVTVTAGIATVTTIAVTPDQTGLVFTYTVQDTNGTSSAGTVTVNVREGAAPPPPDPLPIYQPYTESSADTVVVASMAALASAINAAPPGRNILIAAGTYTGGTYTFSPSGTEANPVVVRPQGAVGSVVINGGTWTLQGSRFVLSKLYANNVSWNVNNGASFNRISRCRFRQINRHTIFLGAATDTRIDRCDFSEYLNGTGSKSCIHFRHSQVADGTLKRILIDYCYAHDIATATGSNGQEIMGQTSSSSGALFVNPEAVIDHCLFRNIGPVPGEGEVIGAKSTGLTVQFCTFEGTHSSMYLNFPRQGELMTMRSSWFENNGNSSFFRLHSDDGLVIGNRFIGTARLAVMAGTHTWDEIEALGAPPALAYSASRRARIIGNILDTGVIEIGRPVGSLTSVYPASASVLEANIRNGAAATTGNGVTYTNQSGTTISASTAESYVPAVKLLPADVGLNVP